MAIDLRVRRIVDDFKTIEISAMKGVARLRSKDSWSCKAKAREIENAVHRLALLIMQRYGVQGLDVGKCTEQLDPAQVANRQDGCLNDLKTMLACKVFALRRWTSHGDSTYGDPDIDHETYLPQSSILKALNASRNSIFFWIEPTIGPLWGKADTLIEFEREVFSRRA